MRPNRYNQDMPKRLFLIIMLMLLPTVAVADDSNPQGAAPIAPSALGPGASNDSGGSTADSGALQPAGKSPLQSITNDSADLSAPSNLLQGSVPTSDSLKVLSDETDGAPHNLNDDGPNLLVRLAFLLPLTILIAVAVIMRDRRRFRGHFLDSH